MAVAGDTKENIQGPQSQSQSEEGQGRERQRGPERSLHFRGPSAGAKRDLGVTLGLVQRPVSVLGWGWGVGGGLRHPTPPPCLPPPQGRIYLPKWEAR